MAALWPEAAPEDGEDAGPACGTAIRSAWPGPVELAVGLEDAGLPISSGQVPAGATSAPASGRDPHCDRLVFSCNKSRVCSRICRSSAASLAVTCSPLKLGPPLPGRAISFW